MLFLYVAPSFHLYKLLPHWLPLEGLAFGQMLPAFAPHHLPAFEIKQTFLSPAWPVYWLLGGEQPDPLLVTRAQFIKTTDEKALQQILLKNSLEVKDSSSRIQGSYF